MMRDPSKKLPSVVKKMLTGKEMLCAGFTARGNREFWLEPSQQKVSTVAASKAIACPIVKPDDGGLFGNEPQIYRVSEGGAQ